jgi:hypothetical protein
MTRSYHESITVKKEKENVLCLYLPAHSISTNRTYWWKGKKKTKKKEEKDPQYESQVAD